MRIQIWMKGCIERHGERKEKQAKESGHWEWGEIGVELLKHHTTSEVSTDFKPARHAQILAAGEINGTSYYWLRFIKRL